jgi:hypothetical protein
MSIQSQEPDEAMRSAIRLAGHKTRLVGWVVACSCVLVTLIMLGMVIGFSAIGLQMLAVLASGVCFCITLFGMSMVFSGAMKGDYCLRRSREIGERLKDLPAERQASVLLPLRDDPSRDVRAIVRPLIERLKVAREVTPASAPDGRGDEPAAE